MPHEQHSDAVETTQVERDPDAYRNRLSLVLCTVGAANSEKSAQRQVEPLQATPPIPVPRSGRRAKPGK